MEGVRIEPFVWVFVVRMVMAGGVGFGQVRRQLLLRFRLPSTASAVSQGGAGKTMLLWPEGAPGALGDEDIDKPYADGVFAGEGECDEDGCGGGSGWRLSASGDGEGGVCVCASG